MQGWMPYHFFEKKSAEIAFRSENRKEIANVMDYSAACAFQGNLVFGDQNGVLTYLHDPNAQPNQIQFSSGNILNLLAPAKTPHLLIVTHENVANDGKNTSKTGHELNFCLTDLENSGEQVNLTFPVNTFADVPQYLTMTDDGCYFAFTIDCRVIHFCKIRFNGSTPVSASHVTTYTLIPPNSNSMITNICFTNSEKPLLYYVTESEAGTLKLNGSRVEKKILKDAEGTMPGLSLLADRSRLAICNGNKVTFFTPEGIDITSPTVELDATPIKIMWYRSYLIAIYDSKADTLRIYELDTHCVFGSSRFGNIAKFILFEWGAVILVKESGKLTILSEIPTEKKISLLCTSSKQFEIALKLSEKNKTGGNAIAEIRKQLGDSKIARRDYEAALTEYIKTIGFVEPSYVITQFLEPQLADYLVRYLEAVHDFAVKNNEMEDNLYTTLRFNCYAKLKQGDSIKKIVDECKRDAAEGKEPNFDISAAVDVLIKSGYLEEAEEIADVTNQFFTYCTVMERIGNYGKIIHKLKTMPVREATSVIRNYGFKILEHFSQKNPEFAHSFTSLLARICTHGLAKSRDDPTLKLAKPKEISEIFISFPSYEYQFYEEVIDNNPSVLNETLWDRAITICLFVDPLNIVKFINVPGAKYSDEHVSLSIKLLYEEHRLVLDNLDKYRIKYARYEKTNKMKPKEIVLPEGFDEKESRKLCSAYRAALVTVYEHRGIYREILRIVDPKDLCSYCRKYEENDECIWGEAIKIAISKDDEEVCKKVMNEALEGQKITLSEALKMLNTKSSLSVMVLKDFALGQFVKLQEDIEEKQEVLEKGESKLADYEDETEKLETQPTPFRPIRCSHCKEPVSFPARYFKCGHAFHLSCLGDEAEFCSICAQKHEENVARKVEHIEDSKLQKQVLYDMKNCSNGMSLLEMALKTGIMNPDPEAEEGDVKSFYDKFLGDEDEGYSNEE